MEETSLPSSYFDDVYAANADPWEFETSEYEQKKYAHTLQSLPHEHYGTAFEIGCSIGVLTAQLAARCDSLLGVDVSEAALRKARARCAALPQVQLEFMSVPGSFPRGSFDLVLVSEVAYYFSQEDLALLADKIAAAQTLGADLVLVHFTPEVPDYPATGDQVHDYFLSRRDWHRLSQTREDRYRIDVLRRTTNESSTGVDGK